MARGGLRHETRVDRGRLTMQDAAIRTVDRSLETWH
jgi:hypothetical protein